MDKEKTKQYVEKENPYEAIEVSLAELVVNEHPETTEGKTNDAAKAANTTEQNNGEGSTGSSAGDAEQVAGETKKSAGTTESTEDGAKETQKININGTEYDEADILQALQDSQNKKSWQEASTKRDQESAALRKAVEPVISLVQKLKEKGDTATEIREILVDELGAEIGPVVDAALAFDPEKHPNPFARELEERDRKIAEMEAREILRTEKDQLAVKYKLQPAHVEDVMQFAVKHFEETGVALSLDDAYKLKNFETLSKKAENTTPPKPPASSIGTREIKREAPAPKKYADIDISDVKFSE